MATARNDAGGTILALSVRDKSSLAGIKKETVRLPEVRGLEISGSVRLRVLGRSCDACRAPDVLALGLIRWYGLGGGRHRVRGPIDFLVAQVAENFQHFAAGRKHPSAGAFVQIHGVHEFDFGVGVVALAGGGVNLPTAADFGPALAKSSLGNHGGIRGSSLVAATVGLFPLVDGDGRIRFLDLSQVRFLRW